jgi:hypothetical protein
MDKPVNYLAGALMLLFGAALGTSMRASEAYLPRIGPPTLRFAEPLVKVDVLEVPASSEGTIGSVSNHVEASVAAVEQSNTASVPCPEDTNYVEEIWIDFPRELSTALAPTISAAGGTSGVPARELLIVTPEMLSEYLTPGPVGADRAATNAVPYGQIWFMPPAPKPLASSKAVYRSQ